MADSENPQKNDGLADLLAKITGNKELMDSISGIVGSAPSQAVPAAEVSPKNSSAEAGLEGVLSNPELMAKLPEVIEVLRPMLSEGKSKTPTKKGGKDDAAGRRIALLYALKPYLSPRRCEAVDYIARISKMGDLLKNIKL